jgi:hypothetical protein
MDANQFFHNVIRYFYASNLAPSVPRSKYFVARVVGTATWSIGKALQQRTQSCRQEESPFHFDDRNIFQLR